MAITKSLYYFEVGGKKFGFSGVDDIYSTLGTVLGIKKADGTEVDAIVRDTRLAAKVRISYEKLANKLASATVLCDPSQFEAALEGLGGKTYRSKKIISARPVRRRVFI